VLNVGHKTAMTATAGIRPTKYLHQS